MTDQNKVWIDPNDCGLAIVEAERKRREEAERQRKENAERQRREEIQRQQRQERERQRRERQREEAMRRKEEDERAKTQALAKQPKPEILPPVPKVPALPPLEIDAMPLPDLSGIEHQMRQAAQMLDLDVPEGRLDRWFGRLDHRIAVKTDRGELLARYIGACAEILVEGRRVIEAAGALQRGKYQLVIDRLVALHTLMQAYYKLEFARRQAIRLDQIEDAKARADIRELELRGRPAPPPPPPLPAPPQVDEATRQKEEARRSRKDMQELELDERAEAAQFNQDVVSKARADAIKIYQNINMLAGERFERIRRVLDSYKVPVTILPKGLQEFMQEEEDASTL
jgi:hypothetical protein